MDPVVAYLARQELALLQAGRRLGAADPEAVHDSRVAVRRARGTLRTFRACFGEGERRALDAALADHARRLGGVRDLEVLAQLFAEHGGGAVPPALTEWIATRLGHEVDAARATVVVDVAAELDDELPLRFAAALGSAAEHGVAGARLERAARKAGRRATRRLRKAGGDADALHEARKAAKRARYAAEVTGDADAAAAHGRVQQVLGHHHDLVVAARWLHDAPVPAPLHGDAQRLVVRLQAEAVGLLGSL